MFARVSYYNMKPGSIEDAKARLETLKSQIMSMPGTVRFTNAINDDGSGCAVSISESREASEANHARVQDVWAHFQDDLTGPPDIRGFDVFVDWSN